ncbi:MAG: tRNA preQ1(34) S-adenosylmethionine ribosyltransferase-isomerase QueA [Candidatus Cloacimonetes bacterium]|nr:tRNA preQ1(34) S-adenosylmethionine ribosyltransferase-isomerase QueA [Candidatus Cloacimonadota bacterium]
MSLTKKSDYWYELPLELIAQFPLENRSESRLLKLNKTSSFVSHHKFSDILDFISAQDVVVVNNTRVIPARLFGHKFTGAKIEVLLLEQKREKLWKCLVKPGRKLQVGTEIKFNDDLTAKIIDKTEDGGRIIEFYCEGIFWEMLQKLGKIPLPPYIKRESTEKDKEIYQTIYAQERGSVAAPTAGLHFTKQLMDQLQEKGIEILEVVLHVGLGTFRPVKTDNIKDHIMHSEHCQISEKTAARINLAKKEKRRVIAVGTTTTRTLESFAQNGILHSGSHWTDIFIYPGKEFQIIDGLITNFHMPESTLMMLVAAFAGYDNIMKAYKVAVKEKYRFFSYGDSMLIL